MKVTFVYPRFEKFLSSMPELDDGLTSYFLGDFTTPPSLGIPILASLTPPDVELEFIDDNSGQPLNLETDADLIAINCFTPQATRAFEIADLYRARGRRVILGGLFPTFMPEECLEHADAVNLGEGEPTWRQILEDTRQGRLQRRYVGGCRTDLAQTPPPSRDLLYRNRFYDWDEDLVQVSRGCLYTCSMCALPAQMGGRIRFRPIDQVVSEIRGLKYENVYLADDTLFFPHRRLADYSRALFEALVPLGKKYFVSSTMALNTDRSFFELAAKAGVRNFYCTLNVEPVSIKALQGDARSRQLLIDLVRRTEDLGMRFFASCGLGRDWDPPDLADRILELFDDAAIHTAEFFIFTPYPGSVHWDRLQHQGRILDRHWAHYNGAHVVARPQSMTPDQLREQFVRVWTEFFRRKRDRHTAALEPATWRNGVQVVGKPLQRRGVSRQAAITGLGLLSPIGHDPATVTAALRAGRHGIVPVARFAACGFRTDLAGEVRDFNPQDELTAEELAEFDDAYLRLALVAARRALESAGIPATGPAIRRDIALVLGTCNGGLNSAEAEYAWKHGRSPRPFDERMNLQSQLYGLGKALASALGLGGETYVLTTACSSTTVALGLAQRLVNRGYYSQVLVGGADVLCVANVAGFDALKATAAGRMAPFSRPYGLNLGEAACFWVVEDMEHALLRGAGCLGRLIGHATTSDGYHPTTPDPRGLGVHRVLTAVLADSGLRLEELGCINAHGTGTEANDKAESKGIARFCSGYPLPAVSTKSFFGHCMGATGILEATCQLLAMNAGFIPPTLNFDEPRPGCTLDYVPNEARPADYHSFLSSNYAFGGNNAAVAICRWDRPSPSRTRPSERVVITGTGCVTSLGLGTLAHLAALRAGAVGLTEFVAAASTKTRARLVGQVRAFPAGAVDRRIDFASLNPISRFAVAATSLALADAGLRVTPKLGDDVGVVMGVCNGPSEMDHMDSVFSSPDFQANVASFSNITANSTAGWVSTALGLRGVNASLSAGPHAGLQALAYAFDALAEQRNQAILVGAADEVYLQTFTNYDTLGFLHADEAESDYRLRLEVERGMVLGEGSGMMVIETAASARARGARVLAEVLGYGMSMDAEGFLTPNLGLDGLHYAVELALHRAGVRLTDVDLLVWAPQGSRRDLKTLDCARRLWGPDFERIPLLTTTFNTGYLESASILVSLAATLAALEDKTSNPSWPQRTGLPELDQRPARGRPRIVVALATSDFGYNFAAVLRPGPLP
jgi:3-oxoacyl-[acyl-carrier-protein] synthase II